ncbi:hypothetical protein, partial [uncultured Bacteroides sp.]|uniref:hypothetical protein n=1 Tax=uncultured Bacteroides sp. TaxID=162156 RepID=UPI0025865F6A
ASASLRTNIRNFTAITSDEQYFLNEKAVIFIILLCICIVLIPNKCFIFVSTTSSLLFTTNVKHNTLALRVS